MEILNYPLIVANIVYLFLAAGLIIAVLAIISPGTGFLEIVALFCLLVAGYGVFTLPINWWALVILVIGVILFIFSVRKPGQWIYLTAAIAALIVGSDFLFRGDAWWIPAVNPILAATVSIVSSGFFWIATRKYLEAVSMRPTHDLGALIGARGEAKTEIHDEGSVQVAGELWSAYSDEVIPDGAHIRVLAREGFILKVEQVQ